MLNVALAGSNDGAQPRVYGNLTSLNQGVRTLQDEVGDLMNQVPSIDED